MAEETIKKIIDVHVEGTESLNDLIKQVDDLSKRLQELDKSSQEYKDILAILAKQQAKINASMRGQRQQSEALEGSYDALSRQMRDLRKEWKATNDEQKRSDLGKEINELNTQLKGMDATIGNFQRNVGNYEGALKSVFKSPKQQIKELRDELAQLTEGTEEYNQKLRELAQLTGDQARLNEQLKYSSADIGDVIGNVAGVAQGIAGGFSALQGLAALFGDDDHFGETIKNLTALIAIVQGLGALEGLQDKLKGLKDAWKGFRETAEGTSGVMSGAGDAMKAVSGNAQGTSGALNKVATSMDGVTTSVEQGTQAIMQQEAKLTGYKNRLMEAAAQYENYIKAHKRGSPATDSAEYKTAQENISLLGKEYERITIIILQLEERLTSLKKKMAEPGVDTKALNEQIKFYEKQISGAKQDRQNIVKENAERKKLNATTKQSISLMDKLNEKYNDWQGNLARSKANMEANGKAGGIMAAGVNLASLSLKGLKAAITATGIGALVVIMGELINLLFKGVDALKGWISGTDKWNKKADELADSLERVNSQVDDMDRATEFQTRVMEAQGKSYDEIYRQKRRNIEISLQEVQTAMDNSEAYQKFLSLSDKQKEKGKYEKVVEEAEKLKELQDKLLGQLRDLDADKAIHDIEERYRKEGEAAEEAGRKAQEAADKAAKATEEERKRIEDLRKELSKTAEDFGKMMESLSQSKENPYERLQREYQNRMRQADEAQEAETKTARLDLAQRLVSREDYEKRLSEISERYAKHRLQLAVDEADQYRKLLGQDVYSRAEKETKQSKDGFDLSEQTRKAQEEIERLRDEVENAKPISLWDILFKNDEPKFKDRLQQMKDSYDKTIEEMNDAHQRRLEQLRATMAEWQEVATSDDIDDETRAKAQEKVKETQNAINDEVTKNLRDNLDQRAAMLSEEEEMWRDHAQRIVDYNNDMVSSLTGMMGSLADIYEQDAENRADGDEKSQKVAKRSFRKAQALRVAEASINTINGAIGSYMQAVATYPSPYGQILGAATSAAALASGMAQIQKIKSQTFDGGSSLSGGGVTYQLPNIEKYEPSYSQNITGESDTDRLQRAVEQGMRGTNIVVRVSDINEAQKTVRVRDNESTW